MAEAPPGSTCVLSVSGLTKHFGRVRALEDVSFTLRAGEVLGLLGPNGAGKTTLLECLAGLLPRGAGSFRHDGVELDDRGRRQLLFYLPDAITPWPAQTVGWALDFVCGLLGGRAGARDGIVGALALEGLVRAPIGALSKGERKRALLAMGLLTPQPVLLVDEPFEGLDLRQARAVALLLRSQADHGRTLFLSIHQIADAARLCDRFVLLSGGRVRGEGTLAELATEPPAGSRDADRAHALEEACLALT